MKKSTGQVLIAVIVLMAILAISLPAIIQFVQNESRWTVKETRTTRAFQLAEAAVERGFQKIITSSSTWSSIQAGQVQTNYNFDFKYTDSNGQYEVRVTSGPGTQQATVTGVGRDTSTNEIRAIKVIYGNTAANAAMYAMGGVTLTSNPGVEWGPVMSPTTITTSQDHPRFYSTGNVTLDPNGAVPPNTDNVQWWSYYPNLPPPPEVDTQGYLQDATALGQVHAAGTYQASSFGVTTGTHYFQGDTTIQSPGGFLNNGNIVVMGDLTVQGSPGNGTLTPHLPPNAWKEYGNDWKGCAACYWDNYDNAAPTTFPGINGSYDSSVATYAFNNKLLLHGFLYVMKSLTITGGGNLTIYGSLYLGNASSLDGSHVKVYYDDSLVVKTLNVTLSRNSWQEVSNCSWSGVDATCP